MTTYRAAPIEVPASVDDGPAVAADGGRDAAEPHRRRWAVLAAGVVAQAAAAGVLQGLPSVSPLLRDEFGLTLATLGLVLAATTLGLLVALVPWGLLADRWGERPVLVAGLLAGALALVGAASARSAAELALALFVAGAACASVNAASGRAVLLWFPVEERGLAMGARQTAIPVGAAVAAVALPLLAAGGGLALAFVSIAIACVLAAVVVGVVVREGPVLPDAPSARVARSEDRGAVVRICVVSFLLVVPQVTVVGFFVVFLVDEHGVGAASAAAGLAAVQLAGGAARILLGAYSDRRGSRLRPLRVVAVSTAVLFGLTALARVVWPDGAVATLVVAGVLAISWNGLAFVAVGELAPRRRIGVVLAVQNTAVAAGMSLAPPLVGLVVDLAGWGAALAGVGASAAAAGIVLTTLTRRYRRPLGPEDQLRKAGESAV